jgi:hypothetical protein
MQRKLMTTAPPGGRHRLTGCMVEVAAAWFDLECGDSFATFVSLPCLHSERQRGETGQTRAAKESAGSPWGLLPTAPTDPDLPN